MSQHSKNKAIKGCGFHHISITTHQFEESVKFYRDLMGMEVVKEMQLGERRLIQLDIGDGTLVELSDPTPETAEMPTSLVPFNHLGLAVDDLVAAVELVLAAGYPITVEPRELTTGDMPMSLAFVKGPNGESIEFMQFG